VRAKKPEPQRTPRYTEKTPQSINAAINASGFFLCETLCSLWLFPASSWLFPASSNLGWRGNYKFLNKSARGSSGFSFASSRRSSFVFSSRGIGTVTFTSTISSPRTPSLVAEGTPFSRKRSFCPDCVPGGTFNSARPSIVGTSIFAPRAASVAVTGITT